jgi:hypothetical protein
MQTPIPTMPGFKKIPEASCELWEHSSKTGLQLGLTMSANSQIVNNYRIPGNTIFCSRKGPFTTV